MENLFEKKTDYGTSFAVASSRDKKEKGLMGSFGNLPNLCNENDEMPVLRATLPPSTKALGAAMIAKIVFFKDTDVLSHPFEQHAGKWASFFASKLSPFCTSNPRFSELRPLRFMPEFE